MISSLCSLTALAFRTHEIKNLLLDLDARGGAGPQGIFLLFFKKSADVLCPKIAVNFQKCARLDNFSTCLRVGNVPVLSKCESDSSCPSNCNQITITPVQSKIYKRLLARHSNVFAERNNLHFGFRKGLGKVMPI